jgi:hypothetical protein
MSIPSRDFRQRFLVWAANYSFYTPLFVFFAQLILDAPRFNLSQEHVHIILSVSMVFCLSSLFAGLIGLLRIFYRKFDSYLLEALVGIVLSLGIAWLVFCLSGLSAVA